MKTLLLLAYIISAEGVSTDPMKTETVRSWPSPNSLTEARSLLGLGSYFRRFIPAFAAMAEPLYRLTDKGEMFEWNAECEAYHIPHTCVPGPKSKFHNGY